MSEQNKVKEIKEVLIAATPGPWMWEDDNKLIPRSPTLGDEFNYVAEGSIDAESGEVFIDISDQDAYFIAKAHEYITFLLSEIERKDEALKRIEEEMTDYTSEKAQRINEIIAREAL